MKKIITYIKILLELSIPSILSYLIYLLCLYKRSGIAIKLAIPMSVLLFVIYALEWVRRFQNKADKKGYEKYLWLITTFILFFICITLFQQIERRKVEMNWGLERFEDGVHLANCLLGRIDYRITSIV